MEDQLGAKVLKWDEEHRKAVAAGRESDAEIKAAEEVIELTNKIEGMKHGHEGHDIITDAGRSIGNISGEGAKYGLNVNRTVRPADQAAIDTATNTSKIYQLLQRAYTHSTSVSVQQVLAKQAGGTAVTNKPFVFPHQFGGAWQAPVGVDAGVPNQVINEPVDANVESKKDKIRELTTEFGNKFPGMMKDVNIGEYKKAAGDLMQKTFEIAGLDPITGQRHWDNIHPNQKRNELILPQDASPIPGYEFRLDNPFAKEATKRRGGPQKNFNTYPGPEPRLGDGGSFLTKWVVNNH